jgi:acetylornithine deacetylase/succinyl-diaminopimelate desuccinylase-like protein
VDELVTTGTTAKVTTMGDAPAVLMETDHPGVEALRRAFAAAYGAEPALVREGGSVPVTLDFQEGLGARLLVTGFGLPDDALHSPNERMSLDQYHRGVDAVAHLIHELA